MLNNRRERVVHTASSVVLSNTSSPSFHIKMLRIRDVDEDVLQQQPMTVRYFIWFNI